MISIDKLGVEFSATPLFLDASFVVNPKDRIALVGKNGAGKSTMLKIIAGMQEPTYGQVARQKDITIGYLPQVMILADSRTVREEAETAFAHISEMQERLEKMNEEIARRTDYESESYMALIEKFTHENDRFSMMGGTNYQAELERTLQGLGFQRSDFDRPTAEFSGGWRMRIELAKLLLQRPDLLLLDEPTNHLDIGSIQWLEQFLAQRANAVILVSHDRAFINNVTNRTIEITCHRINDYKVKYDEYVKLRDERREQQIRAYENQQKEIAEIKQFIETFRYKPTKSNQVQSRIKMLEKIVPIEIDEIDTSSLHLKFPPCLRSGDYPIICEDVAKNYGAHRVFADVNLTIKRGEKVAFVGNNGEGKSTLVKCIMGEIPFEGNLKIGHNVQIGYFAQNQAQLLDGNITVFDTIDHVAKGDIRLKIRDILGAFMFGGEASDKYVKVLSGGERSRLAMIRLLLEPVNLLILDEPTNHLDMQSKEVLKQAIKEFDGTAIIVSHDRDFLDGLVDKVYEFGGGKVREHLGGIYDFLQKKQIESLNQLGQHLTSTGSPSHTTEKSFKVTESPQAATVPSSSAAGRLDLTNKTQALLSYAELKEHNKSIKKAEKAVETAEQRVTKLEEQIAEIETKLSLPENASDTTLFKQYGELKSQLTIAEDEWTEASMKLEELRGN
ncbi:MAG: ABC-F family ATP-binding cassette domain-containing protein [Bacteroidaceae bacterium]|nr:ABC-F family ATP-binding cassette domain-containing protein [Bacteroidaceae bacterium]MCI6803110.1 ABC-F family ATP-binding cassette domain-containing protein [Prevotellaceae bacterium]